jgi:hypothetical protein
MRWSQGNWAATCCADWEVGRASLEPIVDSATEHRRKCRNRQVIRSTSDRARRDRDPALWQLIGQSDLSTTQRGADIVASDLSAANAKFGSAGHRKVGGV